MKFWEALKEMAAGRCANASAHRSTTVSGMASWSR